MGKPVCAFADALDAEALFAPDPRLEVAQTLFTDGNVTMKQMTPPEENTRPETRLEAQVRDQNEVYNVIVAIDRNGGLRFGRCECRLFKKNLMWRGECEHILAARKGLEQKELAPKIKL